ncbi:MAG TPA: hypothetical protein VKH81_19730 [Candidatus Angelobacter sp.]|nr:hypothetical protein [Candidatus Angelobacter sp.]
MFQLTHFRSPSLLALSLFLGLQAMAQFEVSPDHFDSPPAKQTAHRRAATETRAKTPPATKTAAAAAEHKSSGRKNESAATSRAARHQTTAGLGPR